LTKSSSLTRILALETSILIKEALNVVTKTGHKFVKCVGLNRQLSKAWTVAKSTVQDEVGEM
jgi:hypothetical protein